MKRGANNENRRIQDIHRWTRIHTRHYNKVLMGSKRKMVYKTMEETIQKEQTMKYKKDDIIEVISIWGFSFKEIREYNLCNNMIGIVVETPRPDFSHIKVRVAKKILWIEDDYIKLIKRDNFILKAVRKIIKNIIKNVTYVTKI
jgi:hypothetical protein